MAEENSRIAAVVSEQRSRLRAFIARRIGDPADAEDILQDVFYRLVEANRLLMPIEHITGWLFRVARNRITDFLRKMEPESFSELASVDATSFEELLPSPEAGPDALFARRVLLDELDLALDELPPEQRDVFVAHELEGKSFRQISAESGIGINTLLSRKRYAVLHLRERLQRLYEEVNE